MPTRCDWPPRVKGIAASNLSCNMRHSLAKALPQCSVTLHHVAHCNGSGGGTVEELLEMEPGDNYCAAEKMPDIVREL